MAIGLLRLKPRGYDFPPYRPPSEARSLLVRVTRGCPWNRCTFCNMYKAIPFQRRPKEEVFQDIEAARELYAEEVRTVFIGDSDNLVIRPETFLEILKRLYASFPKIERVTSYARAKTLRHRSLDHLKALREGGLTRLHVGLESGDEEVLKAVRKGVTPSEVIEGATKAKEAGFEVSLYVILGLGGQERWREHALQTARVLNAVDPHFIRIRTLVPRPGTPLFEDWKAGRFELPSLEGILEEELLLISSLEVNSLFLSDHISNFLPLEGKLPERKGEMIGELQQALEEIRVNPSLQRRYEERIALAFL